MRLTLEKAPRANMITPWINKFRHRSDKCAAVSSTGFNISSSASKYIEALTRQVHVATCWCLYASGLNFLPLSIPRTQSDSYPALPSRTLSSVQSAGLAIRKFAPLLVSLPEPGSLASLCGKYFFQCGPQRSSFRVLCLWIIIKELWSARSRSLVCERSLVSSSVS